ncbi:Putative oxopyrrolidine biosynthesis cluster protein G [Colletotrichum destructivum]|uniref:Oxopyrrolidine biosynthesis cluster protein G n=1 Tax=Colletotrichum destructivum TaxID=34406 RepID=A0AAX4I046_9PEZI|nr:Putative oxopyrrolidine biosynthesis cluster protein G [Colletotrichum destructivum]
MAHDINLDTLGEQHATVSQDKIFGILQTHLQSGGKTSTSSSQLADAIRQLSAKTSSGDAASGFLWDLWMVVVDLAYLIPPDHPWQDKLIGAIQTLRQTGGLIVPTEETKEPLMWKDLSHLAEYMLDKWFDPTKLDEWTLDNVAAWKNLNSFTARLTTEDFAPWLNFPIWQLQSALDESPDKGIILESRLWVATEWAIRRGSLVFQDIIFARPHKDAVEEATEGQGLGKLRLWKKRFSELLEDKELLGLDIVLVHRIEQTVKEMEEFEIADQVQ